MVLPWSGGLKQEGSRFLARVTIGHDSICLNAWPQQRRGHPAATRARVMLEQTHIRRSRAGKGLTQTIFCPAGASPDVLAELSSLGSSGNVWWVGFLSVGLTSRGWQLPSGQSPQDQKPGTWQSREADNPK